MFVNNSSILNAIFKEVGGSANVTGDYSTTAKKFYVNPSLSQNYILYSFFMNLAVAGDIAAYGYGDGLELTNGINITIEDADGTILTQVLSSIPIKTNVDWGRFVDFDNTIDKGTGNAQLTGDTLFVAEYGLPLKLFGALGHRLVLTFNDNFSATGNEMLIHYFGVKGYIERL